MVASLVHFWFCERTLTIARMLIWSISHEFGPRDFLNVQMPHCKYKVQRGARGWRYGCSVNVLDPSHSDTAPSSTSFFRHRWTFACLYRRDHPLEWRPVSITGRTTRITRTVSRFPGSFPIKSPGLNRNRRCLCRGTMRSCTTLQATNTLIMHPLPDELWTLEPPTTLIRVPAISRCA